MSTSFPVLAAQTQRFTLGAPRNLTISADGTTCRFIRTATGTSPVGQLWQVDVNTGEESLLVDPDALLGGPEAISSSERARRERSRESATGIVNYHVDASDRWACFALSSRLWVTDLATGSTVRLSTTGSTVIDPKLDPTGRRIAFATDGKLRVIAVDGTQETTLTPTEPDHVTWGQADFLAAEEMNRFSGFWWAPDGESLLVQRTDSAPVQQWYISDPANPDQPAAAQRYPAAGTANPLVSLWHVDLVGAATEISWDHDTYEYLARVDWSDGGGPTLQLLSRDQRLSQILTIDPASAEATVVREITDDAWVELSSAPRRLADGRLLTVEDSGEWRRVMLDGVAMTEDGLQVRGIVKALDDAVVIAASPDPTQIQIYRLELDGTLEAISSGAGVHSAVIGGPGGEVVAMFSTDIESTRTTVTVTAAGGATHELVNVAADPGFRPRVELVQLGKRELWAGVLFPREHQRGSARLPILLHPYGGPHAQRVLASGRMFLEPQWLADQGFCVIVADGRGTPGRGHAWEREILHSFADVTLADQVDAVAAIGERYPDDVDTGRVGIAGWSYGGYLSALAVLRRPDVFHAAVAGAPVVDWRLYDTCYTERYLGDPNAQPQVYDANSLLPLAGDLQRPLMLIHGLADDNVVAAHTLQLSSALLAAGRPHTVLPLSGVTHMTPQPEVAENLQLLQVAFFNQHLASQPRAR